MAELIALEVPATPSALSVVRMVIGGVGTRLDFSLEDLDDLFLAIDGLLQAAMEAETLERLSVRIAPDGADLRVAVGVFESDRLQEQIALTPGGRIDLCTLLGRLVDEVTIETVAGDNDGFLVVLLKRGSGSGM